MSEKNTTLAIPGLNPEAPCFKVLDPGNLKRIIENQNEDIFSLKLLCLESQMEINKKDEEIQRLKEIIDTIMKQ